QHRRASYTDAFAYGADDDDDSGAGSGGDEKCQADGDAGGCRDACGGQVASFRILWRTGTRRGALILRNVKEWLAAAHLIPGGRSRSDSRKMFTISISFSIDSLSFTYLRLHPVRLRVDFDGMCQDSTLLSEPSNIPTAWSHLDFFVRTQLRVLPERSCIFLLDLICHANFWSLYRI
ncbi:hypothetical protein B0H11DRAFT_1961941, partial [Mycena galericulata]